METKNRVVAKRTMADRRNPTNEPNQTTCRESRQEEESHEAKDKQVGHIHQRIVQVNLEERHALGRSIPDKQYDFPVVPKCLGPSSMPLLL